MWMLFSASRSLVVSSRSFLVAGLCLPVLMSWVYGTGLPALKRRCSPVFALCLGFLP